MAAATKTPAVRLDSGISFPVWAIVAIIIISPLFQGLFFSGQAMLAVVAVSLTAALAAAFFLTERWQWKAGLPDYPAIILAAAYGAAIFAAASPHLAAREFLKVFAYLAVYWMVSRLARSEAAGRLVLTAVAASGQILALIAVGAAAGIVKHPDAVIGGRLSSTLQYPNALATVMGLTFLVSLTLWGISARQWSRSLAAWTAYSSALVFMFTYSRAAWLLLPVALLVFIILSPYRRDVFLRLALIGAVAALAGYYFGLGLKTGSGALSGLAFAGGAVLTVALAWADGLISGERSRRLAALTVMAAVPVTMAAALVRLGLPSQITARLSSIGASDYTLLERLDFFRDAWKMVKAFPVLGAGGGGWQALYPAFQSYGYTSREVHNYFLQVWVETGAIGFAALIGMYLLLTVWCLRRMSPLSPENRHLAAGALAAGLWAPLHNIFDVSLSMAAIALIHWATLGVVRGRVPDSPSGRKPPDLRGLSHTARLVSTAVCLALGLWAGTAYVGMAYASQALAALSQKDGIRAGRSLERAVSVDPLAASYRVDLGQLYLLSQDEGTRSEGLGLIRRGLAMEPYNAKFRLVYADQLLKQGLNREAVDEYAAAVRLKPYDPELYEAAAEANFLIGQALTGRRQNAEAEKYFAAVQEIKTLAQRASEAAPPHAPDIYRLKVSPETRYFFGLTEAYRGRWAEAEAELAQAVAAKGREARVWLWLSEVRRRLGRSAEAAEALARAESIEPGLAGRVPEIHLLPD